MLESRSEWIPNGRRMEKARGGGETPSTGPENCWLPICNRLRTRTGAEPEIWFRIVHLAQVGHPGAPVAAYREQTIEIALGPKGAFENANIRALTRRVAGDSAVSAALPQRGIPKQPKKPKPPRVIELLWKAIAWHALLESVKIASQADIARQKGITRARVTQIMGMLRLAPEIQERILSMSRTTRRPIVTERMLHPIRATTDHQEQLREFHKFLF